MRQADSSQQENDKHDGTVVVHVCKIGHDHIAFYRKIRDFAHLMTGKEAAKR